MRIAIIDDAGFGSGKEGLFGKELYVELLAELNEQILSNDVIRISLGSVTDDSRSIAVSGSKRPVLRAFYDRKLTENLISLFEKESVDLIHNNVLNARYPRILVAVSKKINKPMITTAHNWTFVCPTGWGVQYPKVKLCEPGFHYDCIRTLWNLAKLNGKNRITSISNAANQYVSLRHMIRNSAAIISPSDQLAAAIRSNLKLEVYAIPNPVPDELLQLRPKYGGEFSVAFVGRLTYEKGVHLIPLLADRTRDIEYHVMGSGPLSELIRKSSEHYRNIIFHGFVTNEQKFEIIRDCSSVIMPTIWREAFGYSAVEAFALGKPVVGFELGGVQELIEHSGCGFTAKLNDLEGIVESIRKTVQDQEESIRQGKKGREYVDRNLTLRAYSESLKSIYGNVLGSFKNN